MAEPKNDPRPKIQKQVKQSVWQRDQGRCVECGSREKLEYDHVIPLSKGGSDTERNIQLLCERCNRIKFTNTDKARAFVTGIKELHQPDQPDQALIADAEGLKQSLYAQVLHAVRVEGKSMRQVSRDLGISFRQVRRINVELFPINTSVAKATLDRDAGKLAEALLSPERDLGKGHDAKQLISALTRLGVLPQEQTETTGSNNVMIAIGSPFQERRPDSLKPPSFSDLEQTAKVQTVEVVGNKRLTKT